MLDYFYNQVFLFISKAKYFYFCNWNSIYEAIFHVFFIERHANDHTTNEMVIDDYQAHIRL